MHHEVGACPRNPKQTGHCMHGEFRDSTAGTAYIQRCCWCGHSTEVYVTTPQHGPYAESKTHC